MSSEPEQQEAIITLQGDDGHSYSCQILDIFEFDNQEYALLLNLGDGEGAPESDDQESSIVIMRLTQQDDQSIFQTIESEEEFDRVRAHVEDMVKQAEAEAEA